jgi:DNA primase
MQHHDSGPGGRVKRLDVRVAAIPRGYKDVADLFERGGQAAGALYERMLETAVPAPAWAIDYAEQQVGGDSPEAAQAMADFLVDYLALLPPVLRDRYVRLLAERIGVSYEAARKELNDVYRRRNQPVPLPVSPDDVDDLGFEIPGAERGR